MEIVSSTLPALVIAIAFGLLGPRRGLWLFFAVMPFGATAAFNLPAVGGTTITVSDLTMVVLIGYMALRPGGVADMLGTLRPGQPGFWLLLFFCYAVIASIFFPRVFEGDTEVFGVGRVAGSVGVTIRPLRPDTGNISQLFRMTLSILVFIALAASYRREGQPSDVVKALCWATGLHVGLGVLDVVSAAGGFGWVMEPLRTANYALAVDQNFDGLKRMVGGFPEASAFGYLTLGLFGFWSRYWLGARDNVTATTFLALTAAVLVRSTSSSAYIAAAAFVWVMVLAGLMRHRSDTVDRRMGATVAVAAALLPLVAMTLVALYQLEPGFRTLADRILLDKISSDSADERMSWNLQALRNFRDTLFLGAGLGSIRASNWLVSVLATTGVFGTVTLGAFVLSVLRLPAPRRSPDPDRMLLRLVVVALQAGCLALLLRAMVVKSSPNLDVYFFAMAGVAAGLSRAAFPRRLRDALPVFQSVRALSRRTS